MDFALFGSEGFAFVMRWLHFFFGITWIGHLYYFNFTQGPFFNEADASTKSVCTQKLVPRALWWFRMGAMYTFVTGWLIIGWRAHQAGGMGIFASSWGAAILTGATLGTLMWANVWFVIWPAQKVVIASATQVASGGQAIPEAAARAARAMVASRTNVLFSIPMLFMMGASGHLPITVTDQSCFGSLAIILGVLIGALQINALKGQVGPLKTVKGVITSGFILTVLVYVIMELCL